MTSGYSYPLPTTQQAESYLSSVYTIDGGDLDGLSPAMDYLDLTLLDGGTL
jgi:hypothetical protein